MFSMAVMQPSAPVYTASQQQADGTPSSYNSHTYIASIGLPYSAHLTWLNDLYSYRARVTICPVFIIITSAITLLDTWADILSNSSG